MEKKLLDFIQQNSPSGGFLQSEYWRKFQEAYGRKTFQLEEKDENGDTIIFADTIAHALPVVRDYFYVPRGPIIENFKFQIGHTTPFAEGKSLPDFKSNPNDKIQKFLNDLINLSNENNIGWIRVEPNSEEDLKLIKENLPSGIKMKKSSVDMQPREILVIDISGSEEEILAQMKQKTRYNIRLAKKKGVKVFSVNSDRRAVTDKVEEFLRLIKITAKRDKISPHPDEYYRKMFEVISDDVLKLYVAECEGKVISANIVSFFGKVATYMHGASDYAYRDVMAPYLLQWQAILDAKKAGCSYYDIGGVKTVNSDQRSVNSNNWAGITKFKTGFAPDTKTIKFPGCWDIVLNSAKYNLYRMLQKIKRIF